MKRTLLENLRHSTCGKNLRAACIVLAGAMVLAGCGSEPTEFKSIFCDNGHMISVSEEEWQGVQQDHYRENLKFAQGHNFRIGFCDEDKPWWELLGCVTPEALEGDAAQKASADFCKSQSYL